MPFDVDFPYSLNFSQQSRSVLSLLIGPVYLDPRVTRSGPENVMFTVVVLFIVVELDQ